VNRHCDASVLLQISSKMLLQRKHDAHLPCEILSESEQYSQQTVAENVLVMLFTDEKICSVMTVSNKVK